MDRRMRPGKIPIAVLSVVGNLAWVVDAGCVAIVLLSPKMAVNETKSNWSKKIHARSKPPAMTNEMMSPPAFICFLATSYCVWLGKKGYLTNSIWDNRSSRWLQESTFSQCRSILTANVSKLFDITQALKGAKAGPEWRANPLTFSVKCFFPAINPPKTLPWLSKYLVAEWMTKSAPYLMGCCK